MIDLSYFSNLIDTNVPEIQQVILPQRVVASTVDPSAILTSLLAPVCSGRAYPYKLPDGVTYPAMTYEQNGFEYHELDGYAFTRSDSFIVSIQADTLPEIVAKTQTTEQAVTGYAPTGAAGGIDITNKATRWQVDLRRYEMAMEIAITHLTLQSQATPVYYLYPLHEKAEENASMNAVVQIVKTQFVGLLIMQMPVGGIAGIADVRDAARNQILGRKKTGTRDDLAQLVQGQEAGKIGSIVLWRDVFSIATTTQYP